MTESIEESEELANLLNERMLNRKGGNNQRLAIMLGWLTKDKQNPVKRIAPSEDRSQYSLEHYKFFLDAPFEISNKCCTVMKKDPAHKYNKETGRVPIMAQMASESNLRTQKWLQNSCNGFDLKLPTSNPMSFWTEQDVLLYIKNYIETPLTEAWENIYNPIRKKRKSARRALRRFGYRKSAICSVYGRVVSDDEEMGQIDFMQYTGLEIFDRGNQPLHCTGCQRTGCVCCGFGAHLNNDTRFVDLKRTHPQMYRLLEIAKNNGYTMREAIDWINKHGDLNIKY